MIRIGKGKLLQLAVLFLSDLRAHSLPADRGKPGASGSEDHGNHRADSHLRAFRKYVRPIPIRNTDIHHIRHNQRYDQFQHRLRHNAEYSENRGRSVWPHIRQQSLHVISCLFSPSCHSSFFFLYEYSASIQEGAFSIAKSIIFCATIV